MSGFKLLQAHVLQTICWSRWRLVRPQALAPRTLVQVALGEAVEGVERRNRFSTILHLVGRWVLGEVPMAVPSSTLSKEAHCGWPV